MTEIKQIGGTHYNNKIQVWDLVAYLDMNFFLGNVLKYVCRYKKKNGKEDLEKALSYLERFKKIPKVIEYYSKSNDTDKEFFRELKDLKERHEYISAFLVQYDVDVKEIIDLICTVSDKYNICDYRAFKQLCELIIHHIKELKDSL